MRIETWEIGRVRPYAGNPRRNAAAVEAVAASIREYGWRQPIVVDADGVVICGHTRLLAAQSLGLAEVPVHVAADLLPAQVRAYRLADNKTGEIAEWDESALAMEIEAILAASATAVPGFTPEEMAKIVARLDGAAGSETADAPVEVRVLIPSAEWATKRDGILAGLRALLKPVDHKLEVDE